MEHKMLTTIIEKILAIKGSSSNQVKPVRILDTPQKEKFFLNLIEK